MMEKRQNGWLDFCASDAKANAENYSLADAITAAKKWASDNADAASSAAKSLHEKLEPGPVHAACLGFLHDTYGVPKPVSAWIRTCPQFKYFPAKANTYVPGAAACALADRCHDRKYWAAFRNSLGEGATYRTKATSRLGWDAIGVPGVDDTSYKARIAIFRAFLLAEGFTKLSGATDVSQKFLHVVGMSFVDFFSGKRMKEVVLMPEASGVCKWEQSKHPPFLYVKPVGAVAKWDVLNEDVLEEIRLRAVKEAPESIDFAELAEKGNVSIETVYISYLREIAKVLSGEVLNHDACTVAGEDKKQIVNEAESDSKKFYAVVSGCYEKADNTYAVMFEDCIDVNACPLPRLEGVLFDFGANRKFEVGCGVIGEYQECNGIVRVTSLELGSEEPLQDLEQACMELLPMTKNKVFHEQDTIERLIVPTLRYLGWNVDGISEGQLVRGSRDMRSSCRNFDLNLYKDIGSGCLSVGIECKPVSKEVPKVLFPRSKKTNVQSSDLPGIFQVVVDYFSTAFGVFNRAKGVKYGYTAAIWTNGRSWIVLRKQFEACIHGCGVDEVPDFVIKNVCAIEDERLADVHLYYRRFDVFDSDGRINSAAIRALKKEIGEASFRNAPHPTAEKWVYV